MNPSDFQFCGLSLHQSKVEKETKNRMFGNLFQPWLTSMLILYNGTITNTTDINLYDPRTEMAFKSKMKGPSSDCLPQ